MNDNKQVLDQVRKELLHKGVSNDLVQAVDVTDNISFLVDASKRVIRMVLSARAIQVRDDRDVYANMQDNEACFEGWACVLRTHYDAKDPYGIELCLDEEAMKLAANYAEVSNNFGLRGHYYRFLYRALRFREQYAWFGIEKNLKKHVDAFGAYLCSGQTFTNNYPEGEKELKVDEQDGYSENAIEDLFADFRWQEGCNFTSCFGENLHRQLPVGMFQGVKGGDTAIFTGKKSAIDLWSVKGNTINVFELKYENKMVGIITEAFFYCNYMRDMYCLGEDIHFCKHKLDLRRIKNLKKYRGYHLLSERGYECVNGYLLYDYDNLHQTITKEVVEVLNQGVFAGGAPIHYGAVKYEVNDGKLMTEVVWK